MPTTTTSIAARLLAAAHFAADRHRDQRRLGVRSTPYINHPLEVAERILRVGGIEDCDILVAAILHDTIEDTETTPEEIRRHFGPIVADLVVELSDDRTLPWQERKRLEIAHAPSLSPPAKIIKISDKTSNVADTVTNPPKGWSPIRRREYLTFAAAVVAGCRGVNFPLEAEFDRVLSEANRALG